MVDYQVRQDNDNEPLVLSADAETEDLVLASGHAELTAGTVLGEVNTTDTYVACDVALTSGQNIPKRVLAEDVAASSGQTETYGYSMALLAESKLSFGGSTDLDSRVVYSAADTVNFKMRDALRLIGLRVAKNLSVTAYENS